MGVRARRVTLDIVGHEIEADIALKSGGVGARPLICSRNGINSRDGVLEVLGQANERVALRDVVGALDIFDVCA